MAEIWARTWYEFSAHMPLETNFKRYTGQTRERRSLQIGGKNIKLYISSGILWSDYDKITVKAPLRLPLGGNMPIAMITEHFDEYELVKTQLSPEGAEKILQSGLKARLNSAVGDGEIVATRFTTGIEDGIVTVTLNAECLEQIAAERDLTEAELADLS
jgi:similar to stage IV sporulation protein